MIGYISGEVIYSDPAKVVLKTASGIGYEIFYSQMVSVGQEKELFISQIIRETSQDLFGFDSYEEKEFFELLLSVNGVGPKSAYSLLNNLGAKALTNAVLLENKKALQQAPGIGPKAAAQIILTMKDKVKKLSLATVSAVQVSKDSNLIFEDNFIQDALLACRELGFQDAKILSKAQMIVESKSVKSSEELIKLVLQELR